MAINTETLTLVRFHQHLKSAKTGPFIICCILLVIWQGVRTTDNDLADCYGNYGSDPNPLTSIKGYLLEGMLNDGVGMALVKFKLHGVALDFSILILGIAILLTAIGLGVRNNSFRLDQVFIVVYFSHALDTLSLWIGKFDGFLLGFMLLMINRSLPLSLAGSALAAFCHPEIAVLTTVGIFITYWRKYTIRNAMMLLTVAACSLIDLELFHRIFHIASGRDAYFGPHLSELIRSSILYGLPTFLTAILIPILTVFILAQPLIANDFMDKLLVGWLVIVSLVSCVLTFDHTRVATLLVFTPLLLYIRERDRLNTTFLERVRNVQSLYLLGLVVLLRTAVPHFDNEGPHLFDYQIKSTTSQEKCELPAAKPIAR